MPSDRRLGARLRGVRRSTALTVRGVGFVGAALACFLAASIGGVPALLRASGLLLGLVVASTVVVVAGQHRLRVDRTLSPQVVAPDRTVTATLTVANVGLLPCLEARWQDTVPRGVTGTATGRLPALSGSRGPEPRVSVVHGLTGRARGRHVVGPLLLEATDPFGLVRRRHRHGDAHDLVVLPRCVDLPTLDVRGASDDGASRPAPQHVGVGEDDVIARSYQPGDAVKRVHWKATAHRGALMVRQEEQQVNPEALVLLDTDAAGAEAVPARRGGWDHAPVFEWQVSAAASVASHLVRSGHVVALATPDGQVGRVVAEGRDTLEDALVDLAVVQPSAEEARPPVRHAASVHVVLGRVRPDRAAAWVTALAGSRTVRALVAASSSPEAIDLLEDAGWTVARYRTHDDLVDVWSTLGRRSLRASR